MTSPDSDTEELDEVYLHTVTIQGREFHKFSIDNRIAFEPVDDEEAERLDLQHRVFFRIFDGRLIFPPIPRLRRVLDCGYGAGSWAVDVATQYPDCRVIGLDISPHKNPDDMPENLSLQVDDLNRRFTFPSNHFDLVHSSLLATGINRARWPSYLADIRRVLKPGGWVQLIEIYFNVQSDNGSITEEHALRRWSRQFMRSYEGTKDLRVGTRLNNLLRGGGFEDIDARMIPLPLSAWSNDTRMQQIGMLNRENVNSLLPSLALYPLTQISGMPQQDFQDLITQARQEAETASLKAYFPLYVCIGRKPG
ncbi:S-adenosyl-L-methionine-dependent methyltransferase [Aspergillus lentulus]|uniref:S-adenosyl-L-methionine-dependent methyltransferase n=1 Tax=Aspergillus lentulus TaxID=293939 RepID=A0ABQ1AUZ1_ASPLE|nr:S-adenosyl-L-methionine-dependent methyltransferase [Aspergillus lentulus]GFF47380.1 S-adenosyl-L-methionine-dependent methyltransferase [Aspergillus lentulus]GFF71890.1 S-adenosyl-L-methionine-dependent methyltransferase [Aspergillus lentulus]GFF88547.1 S-adenosyl-L-methionine-dependent methyltransferase [Aspergillus lentulus]GFF93325.1 S-adenosyl-L-methionine-dependent methyltransferase [Aspergillus lentulus]GFG14757.1 S-adenosyl-L-methionine-dependent methyltransferase [Aspergillus lentu